MAIPPPLATESVPDSGPERSLRLTGQPINSTFVVLYVLAIIGLWIAILTPTSVTLALAVATLDPDNKASLAGARRRCRRDLALVST